MHKLTCLLLSLSLTQGLEEAEEENRHLMQGTDKPQTTPDVSSKRQLLSDITSQTPNHTKYARSHSSHVTQCGVGRI